MRTSDFDPASVGIFNKQLKNAIIFVLVVFSVLVLRMWLLQIVYGPTYRAKSENNRIRLQDIAPFRGMVMDRNGQVLVDNRPSYDLYAIPEEVQYLEKLLENLDQFASLNPEIVKQKLKESSSTCPFKPICLIRDMSRDTLALIETHRFNLPGVIIKVEPQRHYIYESLAFHLLGYLGEIGDDELKSGQYPNNKSGDLIGKSGVESQWQTLLNGVRGGEQVEVDAAGRKIRTVSEKLPLPGANVCLTIDKDLQVVAEKALTGKKGAIVALNPNSGEILTLASSPSVDPNVFIGGIDKATWEIISTSNKFPLQNRALSGQYPPASVFKIIVAFAGLEEGIIDPQEDRACNGAFFVGNHRYNCWRKYGHGIVNLHKALVESCDVYFYKVGQKLGVDRIADYATRFGFGKVTGLETSQEKEGLIPTSEWKIRKLGEPWQEGETVSTAIGQSFLLVTPIQMANFVASVFNGGLLYRPQLTKWIGKSENDKVYEFSPELIGKIKLSQGHFEIIRKALIGVVNEPRGTGTRARLKNITVAGKTGTAQVVALKKEVNADDEDDIPLHQRDHAWFVAVAPAENPSIALAIVIEHGGHGGSAAAPIARDMIEIYLRGS